MDTNSFYCPTCREYKMHHEISGREFAALHDSGRLNEAIATVFDVTGLTKVSINTLVGIRFWKCSKCGRSEARKINGDIDSGWY